MTTTSENTLREETTHVEQNLYMHGYIVGTVSNISTHLPDGWFIAPTDACPGMLNSVCTAKMLATGEWVSGDKPSKVLTLCRGIYDCNAETHAVMHTHSMRLVALMLAGVWHEAGMLSPIIPYYVMKVGRVPFIAYRQPGHSDVAMRITTSANGVHAVLPDRPGFTVWHGSVSAAAYASEELEETARLWLMTKLKPTPLSDA